MKKLLVLAALSVAATPAMASKARLTSLGNAVHLIDTQTIFVNTADMHYLGDFATIEFGTAANDAGSAVNTPRAEGGFVRSSSMGKWGAYLGRQSATVNQFVDTANTQVANALAKEQNALDLFYGTELAGQKWGFGVHYSAAKLESDGATPPAAVATQEVNTLGISGGVRNDVWDAYARIGLGGETKAEGVAELKQKGLYDVGFGMWFDSVYVAAKYLHTKGTLTAGGNDTDAEKNQYSVNVLDNVKVDGGNFFYGAGYASNELKFGTAKTTTTGIPFIVGMEMDAASWLVLRGSITQNVILGETKTETGAATYTDKQRNNTVVAAGAGVKFNKLMLDATISGSGATSGATPDGTVSGNNLLSQASLTYMF